MILSRRNLIGATAALSLLPVGAWAQPLVLKSADVHPLGYPTVVAVENMGKKLAEATDGRLSIEVYPVDAARRREGVPRADAGRRASPSPASASASWAPITPTLNVFNLPFVFRDVDHMHKVVDGELGDETAAGDHRPSDRQPDRPRLDGWRHAQPLQRQGAGREDGGRRRPQDPRHGQPDLRRHDERDGRQRRVDGHGPAHERAADRRGRRRGEQLSDLCDAAALQLRANTTR